jgi:hypothetical protein
MMLPIEPDLQELMITEAESNHITGKNRFFLLSFYGYLLSLEIERYKNNKELIKELSRAAWAGYFFAQMLKDYEIITSLLANYQYNELIQYSKNKIFFLPSFFLRRKQIILVSIFMSLTPFWSVFLSYPLVYFSFIIFKYSQYMIEKSHFSNLIKILKEVEKHNQIIANLHTLYQLEFVGNPVSINDRSQVIEALKITRAGLVRALQTERILRENPNFQPQYFNIDLSSVEAERTMVRAVEYAQLLDDAVQIGVSLQQEMRKLQSNR